MGALSNPDDTRDYGVIVVSILYVSSSQRGLPKQVKNRPFM